MPGGEGGVGGEDVGQDVEDAPAVEEEVVEGPDEVDLGGGQAGDGQPHEGGCGQVEAGGAVVVQEAGEGVAAGRARPGWSSRGG